MKKLLWLITFLAVIFWNSICSADLAWYSILSYASNYVLDWSWNLSVEESINVNFSEERHGIYRNIPYKYSNNYLTPIKNVDVKWWKFKTSTNWNNFQIKIWDPNKTIKWRHYYLLKYNILWTVRQFDWYQELYWNLLWYDRNTEVNNYTFYLELPENIKIDKKDFTIYYWKNWSKKTLDATLSWNKIYLEKPINLKKNQSVTIVVKLKDGSFKNVQNFKTTIEGNKAKPIRFSLEWFIDTIKTIGLFLFFAYILITVSFWFYTTIELPLHFKKRRRFIRDVIHYTAPKWYSPADISLIYAWHKEIEKFVVTQIYSRVNEWLLVPEIEKNFLWIKHTVFRINYEIEKKKFWGNKLKESEENDVQYEKSIEESLWQNIRVKKWEVIINWKIKKKFEVIDDIVKKRFIQLSKSLTDKSYNVVVDNKTMKVNLWFLSVWGFILGFWYMIWEFLEWLMIYCWIVWICSLFIYLIFYIKAQKLSDNVEDYLTEKWEEVIEQILWFRKYLLWVEDERLNTLLKEDPKYCEKVLPYAIALWIWSKWIKKCKLLDEKIDINIPEMEYDSSFLPWTAIFWALSLAAINVNLPDLDSGSWSNRWSSSGSSSWYSWGWWWGWWGWSW